MKQVLFMLAVLGALLSGWLPAMAATLHAAHPVVHAEHAMGGKDGAHDKMKPAAHPVACSACFAIEAGRIEPAGRVSVVCERTCAVPAVLAGLDPRPLDPPPRS